MPTVSVLIPTYNRAHTLKRAIDSVFAQTFEDWECLIIDDASTDNTREILEGYNDPRLKVISLEKNQGVSTARNRGFKASQGLWIALLDSDDEWLPHRLESQLSLSKKEPHHALIHGEEIWVRRGKRVNPKKIHQKSGGDIFERCLHLCLISPSATLMKRELYEEFQGFREDFPVCEDYELWLKITSQYEVGFVEDPIIVKYGGHEDQLSSRYKAMDYWRVKAMQELLDQGNLSKAQQNETIKVLMKKAEILKQGYLKHNNLENLPYINDLIERFGSSL